MISATNNQCIALLISIEYRNTSNELIGCQKDSLNMKDFLINTLGYNTNNIYMVSDDYGLKPTKNNIISSLLQLAELAKKGTYKDVLIYYSGHGNQLSDKTLDNNNNKIEDEDDGKDEVLIPEDWIANGFIRDDTIHHCLQQFPLTANTICIFDCCNSATIGDLEYTYYYNNINDTTSVTQNKKSKQKGLKNSIISIAGCKDEQISNVVLTKKGWHSALTTALIHIFSNYKQQITLHQLDKFLNNYMTKNEIYDQNPVISSSWPKTPGSLISLIRPIPKSFISPEVMEEMWIKQNLNNL